MGVESSFRVLTVCTGNICRSPAAEFLLADELERVGVGEGLIVESAGVRPLEGNPVDPPMARLLHQRGIDTSGFTARRLTKRLVQDADLVLGLARDHRTAAVQLYPGALKRTFTLRELARLAERVDPTELTAVAGSEADVRRRLRALVQLAPKRRTSVPPELDDVEDPYRREDEIFVAVHQQILEAAATLVRAVAPLRD